MHKLSKETKMSEPVCLHCGLCCHYIIDGKPSKIPCKFLVKLNGGKTLCRFYRNRLGKDIGHGNKCLMRKDTKRIYPGCPYNGR